MFKQILFFIIISLSIFSCKNDFKSRKQIPINSNWQFKALDDTAWMAAKIPGVVHLDLMANKIISNPFDSTNEQQYQWIGEKTWEYKCSFETGDINDFQNAEIVFEGLDTYAKVFLNDSLILSADNMYRTWRIPINGHLRNTKNILKVVFSNPETKIDSLVKSLPYVLPDKRGFARKAPYHFGWDWGAKFITAGIWKKVYLDIWDNAKINNVHIIQHNVDSAIAILEAKFEIEGNNNGEYSLEIIDIESGELLESKAIAISEEKKQYSVNFEINNPKLWWCNGMGEANLYELGFRLIKDNQEVDYNQQKIGIRTIELVQEADGTGKSFFFKLNGKPIFIKGANFVPADNFLPRIDKAKYKSLIDNAVWANFNMLRVWGGGIYESDDFYDLCDEKGILVWQDFMFTCNMYPGDEAFMNSVKHEAIDNIIRLRNHPSLALWCGNNEVDNGWKDWGWQKQLNYSAKDSSEIWNNYLALFENMLPQLITNYDGQRNYHPSSPTFGWGHKQNFTHGDSHYWGVWWGHEPFDVFDTKVGRFMSEYGFQALPNIKTINEFAAKDEQNLHSKTMSVHQKHPTGYETIDEYLKHEFATTENFEDYIYLSQLTQAMGITKAIEAHRRNKPHCMGTLYWQFNDAWPVTSWSSVDYFGRKKALHYFVKKAYEPTIISCIAKDDFVEVFVISDIEKQQEFSLEINHLDFKGDSITKYHTKLSVDNRQAYLAIKIPNINNIYDKSSLLYIKIKQGDSLINEYFYYFAKAKELILPKANIDVSINKKNDIFVISLQSDVLARNVEISTNIEGELSDNYFDILPNSKQQIFFAPSEKGELKIELKTLNNMF